MRDLLEMSLARDLLQAELSPRPTVDSRKGKITQSHSLLLDLKESAQMCKVWLRLARPLLLPRFPSSWSQAKSLTTPKFQTYTTSSRRSAKAALSSGWTRSTMCTLTCISGLDCKSIRGAWLGEAPSLPHQHA